MAALKRTGAMTVAALVADLGENDWTVRREVTELQRTGFVFTSGLRTSNRRFQLAVPPASTPPLRTSHRGWAVTRT